MKDPQKILREHVAYVLGGGGAHAGFDQAVDNMPEPLRGVRPEGAAHSAWELIEHMRIAQWDILEFSRNPAHASPEWPGGYWPKSAAPPDGAAWDRSVARFRADLAALRDLAEDPAVDLFARIPHGDGQTVLREALLAADHNAYHIGELVFLRRVLGAW
ncbi:MAG TPA: DinB family protein [Bryobacteraceae bacterium]